MTEEVKYPKCKGKNCGCTDGRSHSAECVAEHEAACNPDGIYSAPAQPEASPEPQARESWWMIHFDDTEVGNEYFNDEIAAIKRFEQAKLNWNCTLFVDAAHAAAQNAALRQELNSADQQIENQATTIERLRHELSFEKNAVQVELQRAEAAETEVERLRHERDEARKVQLRHDKGESWFWQGDGNDFPESLNCPIIMQAETLRSMLSQIDEEQKIAVEQQQRAEAAESEVEQLRQERDRLTEVYNHKALAWCNERERAEAAESRLRQREEEIARLKQELASR